MPALEETAARELVEGCLTQLGREGLESLIRLVDLYGAENVVACFQEILDELGARRT